LGVTRGAFYYYISDKDDLLERCFDRTCDTIENALVRAKQVTHPDAIGVMEQTLRSLFEGHITDLDPLLRLNLLGAVSPAKRRAIEARLNKLRASFSEIIANAMVDGSARPIDLDALENLLMGTLFSASRWRLAATPLHKSWKPTIEPVMASAAYFEPLLTGYGRTSR
jgi:AcrR family transcriptional regulator